MGKKVVYTALVGAGYDTLIGLKYVSADFDYICFVRKGEKKSDYVSNWKIVEIDYFDFDNGRLSRFPKLLPHETCIKEYDYSLYIDANIDILDQSIYDRFDELCSLDVTLALLKHPFRDCVYQEAYVCVASGKGGWFDIVRQIFFLKVSGIRTHSGLFEANVIFRKHNDNEMMRFGDIWWKTFMRYSKRDQLSLVYALSYTKLSPYYFLPPEYTTRNYHGFCKRKHIKQSPNKQASFKMKIVSLLHGLFVKVLKD